MRETFLKRRPEWLVAALLLGAGCSESRIPVSLPFEAAFNGNPIDCSSENAALSDLRLYVADVQAKMADGKRLAVPFVEDQSWQTPSVALIDLENGEDACNSGTPETRSELTLLWPAGDVNSLVLTVGVPFSDNHADPLQAPAPLDDSAMHWHWRSGYKFLRAGIDTDDDGFWLHLGSTGCEGTTGNITGCTQPNRITLELDGFVAGRTAAVVHLEQLFHGIDLDDGQAGDCSSGPMEPGCKVVLSNLGLEAGPARPWLTLEPR
ncbi:MAG: MbnP family copper-binding protein [Pseudomonadota bacterium]